MMERIAVIGAAGMVGSSVVAQLAGNGVGQELYLQDLQENLVESHRIDLTDAQTVLGLDTPELINGPAPEGTADLVVVAASIPENPEGDRREFLDANAGLLRKLAESIHEQLSPTGLVLLLTNPVDILADWLSRTHGFDPRRLIGYALNDTARFQSAIAREFGVETSRVEALVLGEHGQGQVPIFSTVKIDGELVTWEGEARQRLENHLETWFARWLALKSGRKSGWATGFGVMKLVRELEAGNTVTTTVWTRGIDTLPETYVSLPTRLTQDGEFEAALPTLDDDEFQHVLAAANSIHAQAEALEA
ncbi:malate dehydrogenase [Citricoccus sp. GCM10030269]|uniref:malate dehydrogenase n=1 Tax=Citricoccus sp. GCM10030269 TaxID=3273388 RepID=UPI00361E8025